ncbi:hypothetical protein KUCAC02_021273 [Chaenocephalus aceratus]|uniref:Uncharacterized protein n=1 Tax=Chaenocephalus aceratus TaxID=36190 RepID=A0ACB9XH01_CHAAC|nr:hypothetical protein KUCAC02_021273 [Chaenocephalus aceratus]
MCPGCSAQHHIPPVRPGSPRLHIRAALCSSSIAICFPSLRSRPGRSVAAEETPESRALRPRLVPGPEALLPRTAGRT